MAEFVNKVTRTVKKVTRKATSKAGEIAVVTKATVKMKAKEADFGEKLEQLGKLYYSYVKSQSEETLVLVENCVSEIKEMEKEISELRAEIAKAKGEIVCTKCGSYVSSSKETCPKCKNPLERIEVVAQEGVEEEK